MSDYQFKIANSVTSLRACHRCGLSSPDRAAGINHRFYGVKSEYMRWQNVFGTLRVNCGRLKMPVDVRLGGFAFGVGVSTEHGVWSVAAKFSIRPLTCFRCWVLILDDTIESRRIGNALLCAEPH